MTTAKCFSISFSVFYSHLPHTSFMESSLLGTSLSSSEHRVTKLQITFTHRSSTEATVAAPKLLVIANLGETKDCSHLSLFVNQGDSVASMKWVWWHLPRTCITVTALFIQSKAISPNGEGTARLWAL